MVNARPTTLPARFDALDGWRGVGAILVALYHVQTTSGVDRGPLHDATFVGHSYLLVDFFFVLSGFVICHSNGGRLLRWQDGAAFMARRFGRVWPLHAVVLGVYVWIELSKLYLAHFQPGAAFTGSDTLPALASNLLMLNAFGIQDHLTWNIQSWSVGAEFWTYLVFAVLSLSVPRYAVAAGVLGVVGGLAAVVVFGHGNINATYELGFARCVAGFFIGCLTYRLFQAASEWRCSAAAATAIEAAVVLAVVAFVTRSTGTATFAAPFVFSVVVIAFAFQRGAISSLLMTAPLQFLGRISYSIYLIHTFFLYKLALLCDLVGGGLSGGHVPIGEYMKNADVIAGWPRLGGLLFIALYLGVVVFVARYTEAWIERPAQLLTRVLIGRLRAEHPAIDARAAPAMLVIAASARSGGGGPPPLSDA